MSEHPIWRPNSFNAEEWDRLDRQEQIAWWKARELAERPPRVPLNAWQAYERGIITRMEFPSFVFGRLTTHHARQTLDGCPVELIELLHQEAAALPENDDDQDWSQLMTSRSGCHMPWVTDEEILEEQRADDRRFRDGVRAFRMIFAS